MESYSLGSKTIRAMLSVSEMTEGDVTERRDDGRKVITLGVAVAQMDAVMFQ
jgi:hypothetical protein